MKTITKKIIISTIVLVLTIVSILYFTEWRVQKVNIRAGPSVDYLENYQDYYIKTEFMPNKMPPPFGSNRQIIYFKPGQKQKMLENIKKDINDILKTLIEEHSDIFYKYEISDDFMFVNIYLTSKKINTGKYSLFDVESEADAQVKSLIPLYHEVKDSGIELHYPIIRYVEPDN